MCLCDTQSPACTTRNSRWFVSCRSQELNVIFNEIDTDHSGHIDFDEFVTGVAKFVLEKTPNGNDR